MSYLEINNLSNYLQVKQELLVNALTQRRAVVSNDTLVLPYMLKEVRKHEHVYVPKCGAASKRSELKP